MNQFRVMNGYICVVDTTRYDFWYGFWRAVKRLK